MAKKAKAPKPVGGVRPSARPKSGAKKFTDAVARAGGFKAVRKASQRMRDK